MNTFGTKQNGCELRYTFIHVLGLILFTSGMFYEK